MTTGGSWAALLRDQKLGPRQGDNSRHSNHDSAEGTSSARAGGSGSANSQHPLTSPRPSTAPQLLMQAHRSPVDPVSGKIHCKACGLAMLSYSRLVQHIQAKHGGINSVDANFMLLQSNGSKISSLKGSAAQPRATTGQGKAQNKPNYMSDMFDKAFSSAARIKVKSGATVLSSASSARPQVRVSNGQPLHQIHGMTRGTASHKAHAKTGLAARGDQRVEAPAGLRILGTKKRRLTRVKRLLLQDRAAKALVANHAMHLRAQANFDCIQGQCEQLMTDLREAAAAAGIGLPPVHAGNQQEATNPVQHSIKQHSRASTNTSTAQHQTAQHCIDLPTAAQQPVEGDLPSAAADTTASRAPAGSGLQEGQSPSVTSFKDSLSLAATGSTASGASAGSGLQQGQSPSVRSFKDSQSSAATGATASGASAGSGLQEGQSPSVRSFKDSLSSAAARATASGASAGSGIQEGQCAIGEISSALTSTTKLALKTAHKQLEKASNLLEKADASLAASKKAYALLHKTKDQKELSCTSSSDSESENVETALGPASVVVSPQQELQQPHLTSATAALGPASVAPSPQQPPTNAFNLVGSLGMHGGNDDDNSEDDDEEEDDGSGGGNVLHRWAMAAGMQSNSKMSQPLIMSGWSRSTMSEGLRALATNSKLSSGRVGDFQSSVSGNSQCGVSGGDTQRSVSGVTQRIGDTQRSAQCRISGDCLLSAPDHGGKGLTTGTISAGIIATDHSISKSGSGIEVRKGAAGSAATEGFSATAAPPDTQGHISAAPSNLVDPLNPADSKSSSRSPVRLVGTLGGVADYSDDSDSDDEYGMAMDVLSGWAQAASVKSSMMQSLPPAGGAALEVDLSTATASLSTSGQVRPPSAQPASDQPVTELTKRAGPLPGVPDPTTTTATAVRNPQEEPKGTNKPGIKIIRSSNMAAGGGGGGPGAPHETASVTQATGSSKHTVATKSIDAASSSTATNVTLATPGRAPVQLLQEMVSALLLDPGLDTLKPKAPKKSSLPAAVKGAAGAVDLHDVSKGAAGAVDLPNAATEASCRESPAVSREESAAKSKLQAEASLTGTAPAAAQPQGAKQNVWSKPSVGVQVLTRGNRGGGEGADRELGGGGDRGGGGGGKVGGVGWGSGGGSGGRTGGGGGGGDSGAGGRVSMVPPAGRPLTGVLNAGRGANAQVRADGGGLADSSNTELGGRVTAPDVSVKGGSRAQADSAPAAADRSLQKGSRAQGDSAPAAADRSLQTGSRAQGDSITAAAQAGAPRGPMFQSGSGVDAVGHSLLEASKMRPGSMASGTRTAAQSWQASKMQPGSTASGTRTAAQSSPLLAKAISESQRAAGGLVGASSGSTASATATAAQSSEASKMQPGSTASGTRTAAQSSPLPAKAVSESQRAAGGLAGASSGSTASGTRIAVQSSPLLAIAVSESQRAAGGLVGASSGSRASAATTAALSSPLHAKAASENQMAAGVGGGGASSSLPSTTMPPPVTDAKSAVHSIGLYEANCSRGLSPRQAPPVYSPMQGPRGPELQYGSGVDADIQTRTRAVSTMPSKLFHNPTSTQHTQRLCSSQADGLSTCQPPRQTVLHWCAVCEITCNSAANLEQHLSSKRHVSKAARSAVVGVESEAKDMQALVASCQPGFNGGKMGIDPESGEKTNKSTTYIGLNAASHPRCHQVISAELNSVVNELLRKVKGFQERAIAKNAIKAGMNKWYVSGLKEVLKSVDRKKAAMVIVAPNIEQMDAEGGLDSTLTLIIDRSAEVGVPLIFALTRKRLGAIYGVRKRVSAVALLSCQGVDSLKVQALQLAGEGSISWDENNSSSVVGSRALLEAGSLQQVDEEMDEDLHSEGDSDN
eukprot:gene22906-30083_t